MTSEDQIIALAYNAYLFTPGQDQFRHGQRRKTYNPIHTATTLNRVVVHLEGQRDLATDLRQARQLLLEPGASSYVDQLQSRADLRQFLATVSLFLKTTGSKERKAMRQYKPINEQKERPLAPEEVALQAWRITQDIWWNKEFNRNKLTRMAARIRAARGKWECLAILAQYYPLRGVPEKLVDRLVQELEPLQLEAFQELVGHLLVLYSAEGASH